MISLAKPVRGLLAGASLLLSVLGTLAQAQTDTSQPPDCRPPIPATRNTLGPAPVTAPAHLYAPDSVRGGTPFPFRISVWRAPISGHPDDLKVWMRLSSTSVEGPSVPMPTIAIFQHGKRVGTIPSMIPGPGWSQVISNNDDLPTPVIYPGNGAFSVIGSESVAFDPRASFTLFIEPRNGLWGPLDVRIDVPDLSAPGNIGLIPNIQTGLWWNPDRPGCGLLLDRNEREVVFASWLTYDDAGNTTWFVMPQGTANQNGLVTGDVYAPRGKPFSTTPGWRSPGSDLGPRVGRFQLCFNDEQNGSFTHDVGGVVRTEPMGRLILRNTQGNRCNFGGLWYDRTRDGWGMALEDPAASSLCGEHFTLMTFDDLGKPVWYFGGLMPNGQITLGPPAWFSGVVPRYAIKEGALYRPTGTGYRHLPELPSSIGSPVGWAESRVLEAGKARVDVRLGNQQQVIDIKRFTFEF